MNGSRTDVVVIGAGYAGLAAALRCAGKAKAGVGVTIINPADRFVERVRLHQAATGQELRHLAIPQLVRGRNISLKLGRAAAIDPDRGTVTVQAGDTDRIVRYDVLINATGSAPDLRIVPGLGANAHSLTDLQAAARLLAALRSARAGATVAVCGGGASGIEAAAEIACFFPHVHVTLLAKDNVAGWLSQTARGQITAALERAGVEIRNQSEVTAITTGGGPLVGGCGPLRLQLADGQSVAADLAVWAGPFTVSPLARDSGLACNDSGRMIVDATLCSISHPNVIAAGDAALARCADGEVTRMACATALPMGVAAGDTAVALAMGRPLRAFVNRYFAQCLSLGRGDGLLQFLDQHDAPTGRVVTGRSAAWAKESIVRGTIWSLRTLRHFPGLSLPVSRRRPAEPMRPDDTEASEELADMSPPR